MEEALDSRAWIHKIPYLNFGAGVEEKVIERIPKGILLKSLDFRTKLEAPLAVPAAFGSLRNRMENS